MQSNIDRLWSFTKDLRRYFSHSSWYFTRDVTRNAWLLR